MINVAPILAGELADAVLFLHGAIVGFVAFGLVAIIIGGVAKTAWVRGLRFRLVHLGIMLFVACETVLGLVCPLTNLESVLRQRASHATYESSFMQHWLSPMIFPDAQPWTFTVLHCAAALVAVSAWYLVPPDWPRSSRRTSVSSDDWEH